ncbi:hypothetical protein FVE85_7600 [Porphyridium purpureum]|uniref:Uncharacterized protein n=1 Tax=Porphyridium purpureum TaxID=35688 RepID=A0A5J4Z9L0_PORPP|nr:hypothetical protein FVE85_7600 [Porphyridium purpureum]|eukprot:POR3818..scf295_1
MCHFISRVFVLLKLAEPNTGKTEHCTSGTVSTVLSVFLNPHPNRVLLVYAHSVRLRVRRRPASRVCPY